MSEPMFIELQVLKKEKKKWRMKKNLAEFARTSNAIGEILSHQAKYEDALDEHKEELDACQQLRDVIGCAVAHRKIGECYSDLGNYEEALNHQQRHLELAQNVSNAIEEQRALATIGRTFLCQAECLEHDKFEVLTKAEDAFNKSLNICDDVLSSQVSQKELMEMRGRLYLNLGITNDYKGGVVKCGDYIKKAIYINETYNLTEDLHRCQYWLASIFYRRNSCSQALRHTDEAFASAEKLKDVILQCDTLLLKAKILLRISDFDSAKYYLKKARKLKTPNDDTNSEIERFLQIAMRLCKTNNRLNSLPPNDFGSRIHLHEKLGDLFAKIGFFNLSLDSYNKTLECAEALQIPGPEKAPVHFSLAETHFDLEDYEEAVTHYFKELECRIGNPKEECKTWLNIAECKFKQRKGLCEIEKVYADALACAKKGEDVKLQATCLRNWIKVIEQFGEHNRKISKELAQLENDHYLPLDEDPENSQGSDRVLSDVSDCSESSSDDDMQNEEYDRPCKPKTGRNLSSKKNEKGETPLHRACISGNLSQVRRLIERGHPVNPRDNCGWIPLHEAANHDYYDIVEFLLDKGAWVNDCGGTFCDGITPLHDAACCGNVKIMELLIARGASAISKANDGDFPLDCLVKWRRRAGRDIDGQLLNECLAMEEQLKEAMGKVAANLDSVGENRPRFSTATTTLRALEDLVEVESEDEVDGGVVHSARKRSVTEVLSSDDELGRNLNCGRSKKSRECAVESFQSDDSESENVDDPDFARKEYINAISSVRSASSRLYKETPQLEMKMEEKKTAMVDEEELIVDDWLEEDTLPQGKCRVVDPFEMFPLKSPVKNLTKSRIKKPRMKQLKLEPTKSNRVYHNENVKSNYRPSRASIDCQPLQISTLNSRTGSSLLVESVNELPSYSESVTANASSSSMRVKIRIQDKLLLVPVTHSDMDQTVGWLAEEAAKRYDQMFGLKPILELHTPDGAVLASSDKVIHVVNGNEEIIGHVTRWDLASLPVRYKAACESLKTNCFSNVKQQLEMALISHNLELIDLGLKPKNAAPLFRTLQCHYSLRQLSLNGNCIGNEGIQMLADIVTTLPNITSIDLSRNNITTLEPLSKVLLRNDSQGAKPLQALSDLYLSFNPLGDNSVPTLASVVLALPMLSRLELNSCLLMNKCCSSTSALMKAFSECQRLRHLTISYNHLGSSGVEVLLRSLNGCQITTLDLTSTISAAGMMINTTELANGLHTFMHRTPCVLEELYLQDCQLSDEVVSKISLCLPNLNRLTFVSFAVNMELSEASLIALTNSMLGSKNYMLKNVDFSGCPKILAGLETPLLIKVLKFWEMSERKSVYQLKLKWVAS